MRTSFFWVEPFSRVRVRVSRGWHGPGREGEAVHTMPLIVRNGGSHLVGSIGVGHDLAGLGLQLQSQL